MPTGPAGIEKDSVDAMEGKRPMMLKAIAPTSIVVKVRLSSCLYPSFAKALRQSKLIPTHSAQLHTQISSIFVVGEAGDAGSAV